MVSVEDIDHFTRFGLARRATIALDEVERVFLQKSRECHPDLYGGDLDVGLAEQARLNEAWRVLSDPWRRYPYLAELFEPGIMSATKNLSPAFLAEAMEISEDAQQAAAESESRARMTLELEERLADLAGQIESLLESPSGARDAAVLCHKARYYQRALETLQ